MLDKFPFHRALTPSYFLIRIKQFHKLVYRYFKMFLSNNYGITCILNLTKSSGFAKVTEEAMKTQDKTDDLIFYSNDFYCAGIELGSVLNLVIKI